MRPPFLAPATSRKLSSDEAVVFTMISVRIPGKRDRTKSAQSCSLSFTMIAEGARCRRR